MQNIELYINDQLCDLGDNDVVISYGANTIQDVATRQGNFSNTFSLPLTSNNKLVFGSINHGTVLSRLFEAKIKAVIVVDGIETVNGFALVTSTKDSIELTVYSGNSDWISAIGDKTLNEIDLSDLDHLYTSDNIEANRLNTYDLGFLYPNIYYGAWGDTTNKWSKDDFFPAIFYHRILTQIFQDAGFNVAGGLLEDTFFRSVIYPHHQSTWNHRLYGFDFKIGIAPESGIVPDVLAYTLPFSSLITKSHNKDSKWYVYGANTFYLTQGIGKFRINGSVKFTSSTNQATPRVLTLKVGSMTTFGNQTIGSVTVSTAGTYEINVNDLELDSVADLIGIVNYLFIESSGTFTGTIDVLSGEFAVINSNAVSTPQQWTEQYTDIANILSSEIKQIEFIKDVFIRFGIICSYDIITNTINLEYFDKTLLNKHLMKDVSEYVDASEDIEIKFAYGEYGQDNYFKYSEDSNDTNTAGSNLGAGFFSINNANLPKIKNVFESKFAALRRVVADSKTIACVPIRKQEGTTFVTSSNQTLKPKAAFVYTTTQNIITQVGQIVPGYSSEVYFDKPDNMSIKYSLGWTYLLNTYSSNLILAIQKQKLFNIQLRLPRSFIANIDFSIPIFINSVVNGNQINGVFYLNFIDQYKPGSKESCMVELLPID